MTAYATYTYYTATYLGTQITTEAEFNRLALRASAWVNRLTFQRVAAIVTAATDTATIDLIKMATCAVAEDIQTAESDEGVIQSETIGQNSVTYAATDVFSEGETYMQTAALYLGSTGLMFPGFNTGEYSGDLDADE